MIGTKGIWSRAGELKIDWTEPPRCRWRCSEALWWGRLRLQGKRPGYAHDMAALIAAFDDPFPKQVIGYSPTLSQSEFFGIHIQPTEHFAVLEGDAPFVLVGFLVDADGCPKIVLARHSEHVINADQGWGVALINADSWFGNVGTKPFFCC